MTEQPAIRVRDLRMHYGELEAVRGIDLDVARGEIFCFLGPNGAGKTTTVEILEGYRRRTGGEVEVLGVDPGTGDAAWRGRIGVVLQDCEPEAELTARETVQLYAGFHDAPRPVDDVLAMVGLTGSADVRNARLSGGQQRRLDLALALVGDPELVFLDEPTTGFDPAARRAAWQLVAGLRDLGTTVFLTTHYLEEAEALADRIAVIAGGRIVATGTPAMLADRHLAPAAVTVRATAPIDRASIPAALAGRADVDVDGSVLTMTTTDPISDVHALTGWLRRRGITAELDVRQPTLEDVYLELVAGEVAR